MEKIKIYATQMNSRERIFHIHTTGKKPYLFGKSVVHMEHQFFSIE
jgi:hypothetical protein